jgi:rhamnose transport system permease protein
VLGVLLALVFALARALDPAFLAVDTQTELLTHVWETALLAVPMTLLIMSGGIDLSVGSIMALSAVVLGMVFTAGAPIFLAALLAVLTGLACGLLNGVFVARVRVHPLLVTLATLAAFRGIAEGLSRAQPVSGFPPGFASLLGTGNAGAFCFAAALVLAAVVLSRTALGLTIRAVGFNETAARFSGLPVARVKMLLYALSGLAAGLAAVLFVARRNTAKADIGQGIELDVIAMVVLGGTSIFGGRGSVWGTLLGVLLIHETREFVGWHWNRDELNLIVLGALLIVSVLLNRFLAPGSDRSE